ncbi:ribbon-helix-helix protein [Xanthobacter versatilis]|uniref:ribbon-helix-helix protein n=1 Tax=Xanthobacter autotrophicus (strain ATCC BAA-1158 / Py2) TaxID=78245 RepID=UPI0037280AC0
MSRRSFVARPNDPERWIKAADTTSARDDATNAFTARLTIDVTPDQRARIKIAAFQRGITVADMLRDLLAHEFPPVAEGDTP